MNCSPKLAILTCLILIGALSAGDAFGQTRPRPFSLPNRPGLPKQAGRAAPQANLAKSGIQQRLHPDGIGHYSNNPQQLIDLITQAIEHQKQFPDTSQNRSPWGVMHTTLAWGSAGEILVDGQPTNAITALCENQAMKGVRLLASKNGKIHPQDGPGLQGHPGQFLAILAQNDVPLEQPLKVGDLEFTVADLVQYEQRTCKPSMELTFKLIGLSHYLPAGDIWNSEDGGTWSVERILRLELRQPINGQQTCGGTHRLMAIHLAVAKQEQHTESLEGAWQAAATYVDDYHQYAFHLFNPDGSCSTDWLERRAAIDDPQRRVQTSGHVLEWLAVSLPDERLQDPKLMGSFAYLSALLTVDIGETSAVGPRAHALRAIRIYQDRLTSQLADTQSEARLRIAESTESVEQDQDRE